MLSVETARKLADRMGILFGISLIIIIVNLVANFDKIPVLVTITGIAGPVLYAIYGVMLLQMKEIARQYKTAALALFVSAALGIASAIVASNFIMSKVENSPNPIDSAMMILMVMLVISVAAAIFQVYGWYCEYSGHAYVMGKVDKPQAEAWMKLWKWTIIGFLCAIGGLILATFPIGIVAVIAAILALAGSIIILITGVIKIVYLHKNAAILKGYDGTAPEEKAAPVMYVQVHETEVSEEDEQR